MHPLTVITPRLCFRFCLFALPLLAHASLPESSSVPGGVAVVSLVSVADSAGVPQSWLGEQPVLVTSDQGQWYAVIGLSLDTTPGAHELRVKIGETTKVQEFNVGTKQYPEQHITLQDKGKVDLAPKDEARAVREIATIKKLKHHWRAAPDTDLAFMLPAAGKLGGRFGARRFFNGQPRAPHAGLDVVVASGTPVKAPAHAQVLAVGDYFFNGMTIFIDHGNGLISMYCHLSRIDVQPGEMVSKGQPLGLSGKTGRATGPHLHWSVILNGAMVDPEWFIPAGQLQP